MQLKLYASLQLDIRKALRAKSIATIIKVCLDDVAAKYAV